MEAGVLYLVNESQDKTLCVTAYAKGEHGLTDCNIQQFTWNSDKKTTVKVVAIYFGSQNIQPTQKLGEKASDELLNRLIETPTSKPLHHLHNDTHSIEHFTPIAFIVKHMTLFSIVCTSTLL